MKNLHFELTKKEQALITLIRKMGHGTIDKISVQGGEPSIVICVTQRIDLSKDETLQDLGSK